MMNILVVEDSEDVRKIICQSLDGYEMLEAQDGIEALTLLTAKRPGLALIDVLLPGSLSGLAIAAKAKSLGVPVILMTGGDMRDVDLAGFTCMRKPFSLAVLLEHIEGALGRSRLSGRVA